MSSWQREPPDFVRNQAALFVNHEFLLPNRCQEEFQTVKSPWFSRRSGLSEIIPTRQMKPPSKLFCIGDLIPFDLIWYPLSKSLRVSDFLLSKIYQGLLSKVAFISVYWAVCRWNRIAKGMCHLDFWNIQNRIYPIIWRAVPTKMLSFLQPFLRYHSTMKLSETQRWIRILFLV